MSNIDWKAWDEQLHPTLAYLNSLHDHISMNQADKIHDLLPEDFSNIVIEYDQDGLSVVAMIPVLRMLPIIAKYDYAMTFTPHTATIVLLYRDSISYTFGSDGGCQSSSTDRVGNGFQWSGNSKRFKVSEIKGDWREVFAESVCAKLGDGFIS
ncbi:MAG: hypothetical protein WC052_05730 [Patescibacteria group bacterium]